VRHFLFLLFLWPLLSGAELKEFGYDVFSLRMGVQIPTIPLEINSDDEDSDADSLKYNQNPAPKFGLGGDWGDFGTYISFLNLEPGTAIAETGKTEYFDLQFHFFFGQWGVDLYRQSFQGYYLENTAELMPTYFATNGNLIRNDLRSSFTGVNLLYVVHPERISIGAALNNTSAQTEDGGSWFLSASYSDQSLRGSSPLAPTALAADYGRLGNVKRSTFRTASLGGGYGYTWVFSRIGFIHGGLGVNLGPQRQNYTTQDYGSFSEWSLGGKGNIRLAMGFAGDRYFGGLSALGDMTTFRVENRTMYFNSILAFLYGGVRFGI
jgi:hypothetical protein